MKKSLKKSIDSLIRQLRELENTDSPMKTENSFKTLMARINTMTPDYPYEFLENDFLLLTRDACRIVAESGSESLPSKLCKTLNSVSKDIFKEMKAGKFAKDNVPKFDDFDLLRVKKNEVEGYIAGENSLANAFYGEHFQTIIGALGTNFSTETNVREGPSVFAMCYLLGKKVPMDTILHPEKDPETIGLLRKELLETVSNYKPEEYIPALDSTFIDGLIKMDEYIINHPTVSMDIDSYMRPEGRGLQALSVIAHTNFFQHDSGKRLAAEISGHKTSDGKPYNRMESILRMESHNPQTQQILEDATYENKFSVINVINKKLSSLYFSKVLTEINPLTSNSFVFLTDDLEFGKVFDPNDDLFDDYASKPKEEVLEFGKYLLKNGAHLFDDVKIQYNGMESFNRGSQTLFTVNSSFNKEMLDREYEKFAEIYRNKQNEAKTDEQKKPAEPAVDIPEREAIDLNALEAEDRNSSVIDGIKDAPKVKSVADLKKEIAKSEDRFDKLNSITDALKQLKGEKRNSNSKEFNNLYDLVLGRNDEDQINSEETFLKIATAAKAYVEAKGARARVTQRGQDRLDIAKLALDLDPDVKATVDQKLLQVPAANADLDTQKGGISK